MSARDDLDYYADQGILLKPLDPAPPAPVGPLTYLAGGEVDDVAITLRFFGAMLDPDVISEQLGVSPTTVGPTHLNLPF